MGLKPEEEDLRLLWFGPEGRRQGREEGREERGHYCPRFGGATVWGEIDGCKQQITACSVKGD